MTTPVYLDNQATTPVDPRVFEAMRPYFEEAFGNAASKSHAFGWRAEAAVKKARAQVAGLLGCSEREIIFTSGATESNNLAIKGALEANAERGDHIVTVQTEHKSVLDVCRRLEHQREQRILEWKRLRLMELLGRDVEWDQVEPLAQEKLAGDATFARWLEHVRIPASVTYLPVGADGRVRVEEVERALTPRTVLVSVMLANNEIGTLQPVEALGQLCRSRGVLFHCDAAQGVGKVEVDVNRLQVDLLSLSAHKFYGPKGVGALYVRSQPRVRVLAQMDGGGHERGLRSGTLNVPAIVGMGMAVELALAERASESQRVLALRERLREGLAREVEGMSVNGSLEHRLPGNLNVSFEHVDGDRLIPALKDVAVSSGSACTSASVEPSYVLRACGVDAERARASIRFGVGRFNTEEDIDRVIARVAQEVATLRSQNPRYLLAKAGAHRLEKLSQGTP